MNDEENKMYSNLADLLNKTLENGEIPKEFVQKELDDHSLIELPLPAKIGRRNVGFAYNKTTLQSSSVHKFIDFFKGGTR